MYACNAPPLTSRPLPSLPFADPNPLPPYTASLPSHPLKIAPENSDFFCPESANDLLKENFEDNSHELSRLFETLKPKRPAKANSQVFVDESEMASASRVKFNAKRSFTMEGGIFENKQGMDGVASELSQEFSFRREKDAFNLSMCQSTRGVSQDKKSMRSLNEAPFVMFPRQRQPRASSNVFQSNHFQFPLNSSQKTRPVRNETDKSRAKSMPMKPKCQCPQLQIKPINLDQINRTVQLVSSNLEFFESPNERKLGKKGIHEEDEIQTDVDQIKEEESTKIVIDEKRQQKVVSQKTQKKENPKRKKKASSIQKSDENELDKKLRTELETFCAEVDAKRSIKNEDKEMLKFLMKFLFDFPIEHEEFLNLSVKAQDDIKKFIVDRFFKHEIQNKTPELLSKRSTFSQGDFDDSPSPNISKMEKVQPPLNGDKKLKKIKTQLLVSSPDRFSKCPPLDIEKSRYRYLQEEEVKPGVIPFLENHRFTSADYLGERCTNPKQGFYCFEIPPISAEIIQSGEFRFPDLQDFLRKREILSIVCRRKQQRERRGKRNDEKTKKIFKRIMKSLLEAFKKVYKKTHKKEVSVVIEERFYEHYFGNLGEDLAVFYDPLKKRFRNPRFKSISNDYLAQLKKSQVYIEDLEAFCQERMIIEGMKRYTQNVLLKFQENPDFLQTLDKAKSKFEWVRFELKVAVLHFLFTFQNAVFKTRN